MAPTLIERAVAILESQARLEFLAKLGFNFALAARGCYPSARLQDSVDPAICGLNEAMMLIFQELRHDADNPEQRPTDQERLRDAELKAEHYGAAELFEYALSETVQRLS